jgi:hypothetical protein
MEGQHAVLSPSGADRWMVCPGSVRLSEGMPDTSSKAADEGTAAHFMAAECLIAKVDAIVHLGKTINVVVEIATKNEVCLWNSRNFKDYEHRTSFVVDEDMCRYVQVYLDLVRDLATGGELYVEYALDISHLTGEKDAEGTLDVHIVKPKELIVIDLKYGHHPVYAKDNRQLRMYGLAAYNEYSLLQDFDTVRLMISQPRVFDEPSEHVYTVVELLEFAEEVKVAARQATAVVKNPDGSVFDAWLNPGEAQCKYCRGKLSCPKFGQATQALVTDQFDVIGEVANIDTNPSAMAGNIDHLIESYTPEYLNKMANSVGLVKQWCKAVEEARDRFLLEQNGQLADWKVVQSKDGNREWENPEAAEALMKRMKIGEAHMYSKKLVSAPQAEKLFKEKIIGERQWPKLQELITRKAGGKTVVPATDKRPALTHVADQFDVVEGEATVVQEDEFNLDDFI